MELIINKIIVQIDEEDYERVNEHRWHISPNGKYRYAYNEQNVKLHRFIMNPKETEIIDHINGDIYDNRKSNLRICNHLTNSHNLKKYSNNKSGYTGVYRIVNKHNVKYRAMINYKGVSIRIGLFETPELAARSYDLYQIAISTKRFARTNFPVCNYNDEDIKIISKLLEDELYNINR